MLDHAVTRKDDAYVPVSYIEAGVTENGVEYLLILNNFRKTEEKETELLSVEDIYESIRKKFDKSAMGQVDLTAPRFIYYPLQINTGNEWDQVFDLVPAWECIIERGMDSVSFYIDATDGMEIIG